MINWKRFFGPAPLVLWGVLFAILAGIVWLVVFRKPDKPFGDNAEKAVAVTVEELRPSRFADTVRLAGHVRAMQDTHVSAERPGRIVALAAEKGDAVAEGDLLLRLDSRTAQALRDRAAITLAEAARDLERWTALSKSGAVSPSELDGIRTRHDLARTALAQAEVDLSRCTIQSPLAGTIADRNVENGEYVHEGTPVYRIVNYGAVKVAFDVPEREIRWVTPGKRVPFRVDSQPELCFTGTVSFVAPAADVAANTFRAELTAANPDRVLRPGMIAEIDLTRRVVRDAVLIPLAAVIEREGDYIVFTANGNRSELRVVKLGVLTGDRVVILSGLTFGDRVIVEGHRGLRDGVPITVPSASD